MNYSDIYYYLLNVLASLLQESGENLSLMAPGNPIQLAVPNSIRIYNGLVLYYFGVMKSGSFNFYSTRQFGNALQSALDQFCYKNCLNEIRLLGVKGYPNGRIALALCV